MQDKKWEKDNLSDVSAITQKARDSMSDAKRLANPKRYD